MKLSVSQNYMLFFCTTDVIPALFPPAAAEIMIFVHAALIYKNVLLFWSLYYWEGGVGPTQGRNGFGLSLEELCCIVEYNKNLPQGDKYKHTMLQSGFLIWKSEIQS